MKPSSRILLDEVSVAGTTVDVLLRLGARAVVGHADRADPGRAGAEATLDALAQLTPSTVVFSLDDLRLLPGSADVPTQVVVVVSLDLDGTRLRHTGSAFLQDAPARAGAAAVLHALNRRLEILGI